MLLDDGVRLVKLFMHITPDEQMRRFHNRLTNPLKRWKLSYEDFRNRGRWTDYEEAIEDMMEKTSTRRAPWHLVPANDKSYGYRQVNEFGVDDWVSAGHVDSP
jgi:AMP-polyphosphate phosphotransferase